MFQLHLLNGSLVKGDIFLFQFFKNIKRNWANKLFGNFVCRHFTNETKNIIFQFTSYENKNVYR